MISRVFIFVGIAAFQTSLWAQTTDFQVKGNACIDENLKIQNLSQGTVSFEWDFCERDLISAPQFSVNATLFQVASPLDIRAKYDDGNWYSFICGGDADKLIRLSYGNSLSNVPTQTTIGQFSIPTGVELVELNGQWFGLVGTFSAPSRLYILDFGNSLSNSPTIAQVGLSDTDIANTRSIRIVKQGNNIIAMISNWGISRLTRINFGSQITTTPLSVDFISVSTNQTLGLDIIETTTGNYMMVTGFGGSHIAKLNFGSDWMAAPVSSTINTGTSPAMVDLEFEGGNYFMLSVLTSGQVFRMNFGPDLSNNSPAIDNLGFFGAMVNVRGMDLVRENGMYKSLFSSFSSDKIYSLDFKDLSCSASLEYSSQFDPPLVDYSSSGSYPVTLRSVYSDLKNDHATYSVIVGASTSPAVDFTSPEQCLAAVNNFSSQASGITDYLWSFGDTQTSTNPNPTHQYNATGNYTASLRVTASNGCENYAEKIITIYNAPVADFTAPGANPLCSNQSHVFENASTADPGYPTQWEWSVNNVVTSATEDFSFTFSGTVAQDIQLKASIPGCESIKIKNITLVEGPIPDFTFSGQCEDQNITFINGSSGTIDTYSWNFDDGQSSIETNPAHIFSTTGVYNVTLTASNSVTGCNNTKTKPVTVYSKPEVNFLLSPPPFSCNGTPSQFNDLTPTPADSNIAGWAWDFGDPGSGQNTSIIKNPLHTYANAGDYLVSLTVSTNFACSSTLQSPVTISQTPATDFTSTPTCEDVAVNFSGTSAATITAWNWTIGSTAYTNQNPTHTFNNAGNTNATLNATAANGCIGSATKPIIVPVKLTPDFSVAKNCVNQQTTFTDITNATADPLSSQQWAFGTLGTANGSPVNFTFTNTASVNVVLTSTTQSGCVYTTPKNVNIIPAPQASFTVSPNIGAPPLNVQFTNTSVNVVSHQWRFNDQNNTTSTTVSPSFVYQNLGEYQPELTVFNAQNCSHTTSRTVSVVVPVLNVSLNGLELIEFQNGLKPAVTIYNRGNTALSNVALLLNFSGQVVRERVNATINPNTSYRYVFSFEFPNANSFEYFCVEAEVDDITPDDNEVCLSDQSFVAFPPYPNPAKGSLRLEWIAQEAGIVNLSVINSMGQEQQNLQLDSVEGLNPITITTEGLGAGIYFLKIKYHQFTRVYRVFVSE